jgi:acyl-CoA synthetase (AMP-forming)/AMP-acid ligase II
MLNHLLFDESLREDRGAVLTPSVSTSWSMLRGYSQAIFDGQQKLIRRRVGLSFRPLAKSYAALAALARLQCDVFLLDAGLAREEAIEYCRKLRMGAYIVPQDDGGQVDLSVGELEGEAEGSGGGSLTILTSGSTGEPKAARHSWEGLSRPVRKMAEGTFPVWLLTYRPQLYAGLQVMIQCFADHGTLAIPDSSMEPEAIVEFMVRSRVQYVSATPSYWRRLLMFSEGKQLRKVPLRQITLGGEVVDQPILNQLKANYPEARLAHIYATTELGRCFSVNDGLAGFPLSYLNGALADGVELKISDGELLIRSSNAMQMYDPFSSNMSQIKEWFSTGDLVDIRDGRVVFTGRKTEMINVAGSKVYPIDVERVIRAVVGVADARVYGKLSSIAGELVATDVVAEPGINSQVLKEQIIAACRAKLSSPQLPRLIKFVEKIELSQAGKTLRAKRV